MKIRILFKIDDPKLEKELNKNARKFQDFVNGENYNILKVENNEILKRKNTLLGILNRIKNYDNSKYYIDDYPVSAEALIKRITIIKCKSEHEDILDCLSNDPINCEQIESINFTNEIIPGKKNWFDFGNFRNNKWMIDKKLILEEVRNEIKTKGLDQCPNLEYIELEERIKALPESIDPKQDKDWQFIHKNESLLSEIIGVKPREVQNSPNIANPLGSLFNFFTNLDMNNSSPGFNFSDLFNFEENSSTTSDKGRNVPDVSFNDIGGLGNIIQQVKEVIELPIVAPDILDHYNIKPHKGILLYGPPGCGKTLIAKAIANEINAHFIPINGPEILNKYVGQSEENLREIFKEAQNKAPSIIYFDEFDSLAAHRNEELDPFNARVVNQILTLLDGIEEKEKICVIASTNRIDMIDEAIKRPGRFDYLLEVSKPDLEGVREIFDIYTRDMPVDEDFNKDEFVKKYLNGATGAEINFITTEAAYNSIRRTVNIDSLLKRRKTVNNNNIVIEDDFIKAIEALNKK